ncbi:MAG: FecR domain-containing protein [Sandaracinaceae bacterium]|nr:FecR domain-containing protein [Sandaracinaceae bacterium]
MTQDRIERAREALNSDVDERRVQALWRRVEAGRRGPRPRASSRRERLAVPRSRRLLSGVAVGALVVLLGVGWSLRGDPSGPLRLADGSPVPATITSDVAESLSFDDGSSLALAPGSHVDLLETTPHHVRLALRGGRVTFRIRPRGPRRWEVACGPLSVEVVGTVFTITRDDERVGVDVARGAVLVRGERVPDHVQRLGAGQSLVVSSASEEPPAPRREPAPSPQDQDAAAQLEEAPARLGGVGAREAQRRPGWREHLEAGRYEDAYDALGPDGFQREATRTDDVAELMRLSDLARLAGHPRDAVRPLERIMQRGDGGRAAAIAAYTLGRLRLERLGDPGGAVAYFEQSLQLGLPAALREPARARLVRALHADADPRGPDAARRYLELHPNGASADLFRGWIE